IAGNTITIFSKTYCPYCKRAKSLLTSEFPSVKTEILECVILVLLNPLCYGSSIQDYLAQKTGQRSVPNIFINQKHVGGCDTVVALNSQGKLSELVGA
ncbi:glutaredoxin, partial [Irpex lacteus]